MARRARSKGASRVAVLRARHGRVILSRIKAAEQAAHNAVEKQLALNRTNVPSFGNPNAPVRMVEFLDPASGAYFGAQRSSLGTSTGASCEVCLLV